MSDDERQREQARAVRKVRGGSYYAKLKVAKLEALLEKKNARIKELEGNMTGVMEAVNDFFEETNEKDD